MLTPLSLLSLDQGPKWQEPIETGTPGKQMATAGIFETLRAIVVLLAAVRPPVVSPQSRA